MKALAEFLEARSPFDRDQSMRCISSDVFADEAVNVDTAKEIGESNLKSMKSKCVENFTFKEKSQAVTLNCKTQVKLDNDSLSVDPQLLIVSKINLSCKRKSRNEPQEL